MSKKKVVVVIGMVFRYALDALGLAHRFILPFCPAWGKESCLVGPPVDQASPAEISILLANLSNILKKSKLLGRLYQCQLTPELCYSLPDLSFPLWLASFVHSEKCIIRHISCR